MVNRIILLLFLSTPTLADIRGSYFAVVVQDAELASSWYSEVFDMSLVSDSEFGEEGTFRLVNLRRDGLFVELIRIRENGGHPEGGIKGLQKVGVFVDDLTGFVASLPESVPKPEILTDEHNGLRLIQLTDPFGNVVRVMEEVRVSLDESEIERVVNESISHELLIDLNGDGIQDRMIASTDCGNAGCTYYCFLADRAEYRFIGSLFLHRLGFEVMKTKHNGVMDILAYARGSAFDGALIRYEFNGTQYVIASTVEGNSGLFELIRPTSLDQ